MADGITMRLEGAMELQRRLSTLPAKVEKKVVRRSLRVGAKMFQRQAKANAPVGETGDLKRALAVRAGRRRRGSASVRVIFNTKKYPLVSYTRGGKRYFYPAAVEYGWKKPDGTRHPAQPYFRPAFETEKHRALNATMREMRNGVEAEARKP